MLKTYHHLTRDQRCQIYALNKRGLTQTEIAVDIGVNQGTVSRELSRNKGLRGYRFLQAHRFAVQRGSARNGVAHVMTPCLIIRVETFLRDSQWSPEQICGALNHEDGTKVSHESLYRHIWSDKRAGGTLYLHLRQRGKKRNKRGAATAGRGLIPGRIDIAQRPAIVDAKSRLGDWELDSIIGAKHRGAITSMVERKTKLTKLVLLDGPTSKATNAGILARLDPLREHVHTLTSDNGKEFAGHAEISGKLNSGHGKSLSGFSRISLKNVRIKRTEVYLSAVTMSYCSNLFVKSLRNIAAYSKKTPPFEPPRGVRGNIIPLKNLSRMKLTKLKAALKRRGQEGSWNTTSTLSC